MPLVDFYTVRPYELKPGDIMVAVLTLHVCHHKDGEGHPYFRIYRCGWPPQTGEQNIPQGSRLFSNLNEIAQGVFPVVLNAGMKGDKS